MKATAVLLMGVLAFWSMCWDWNTIRTAIEVAVYLTDKLNDEMVREEEEEEQEGLIGIDHLQDGRDDNTLGTGSPGWSNAPRGLRRGPGGNRGMTSASSVSSPGNRFLGHLEGHNRERGIYMGGSGPRTNRRSPKVL